MVVLYIFTAFLLNTNMLLPVVEGGTEAEMRALLTAKLNSTDYSPKVRPIKDTGSILRLEVDMYLVAINNVDEVEQKITTTAYMKIKWSDTFMTWNASDYGNISEFTLPQDELWKPDLALANAFDSVTGLGDKFMHVTVTDQGSITWEPYQVFESTCDLDMTYFPFDSQTCDLQLVTWSSTSEMIRIVTGSDGFVTDSYEPNANWKLESVSTYDSSTSSTSGLSFSMSIRRKPIFYLINFIIPIALLSILNTFVFILPCDSGEKTGYAIILFLSFAIFLLIVTEIMPEGMNTIPVMSTYLLIECVFSTLIVFLTIIQLRLHNQGDDTPVPGYLQVVTNLVNGLKRKACCENTTDDDASDKDTNTSEGDIPLQTMKTHSKKEIENGKMMLAGGNTNRKKDPGENRERTKQKPRGICCGGDDEVIEIDNERGSRRNSNERYSNPSSSRKTSIKLSDILGNNNKISPNEYFRKPAAVNSIAIEDFDDEREDIMYKKATVATVRINAARDNSDANSIQKLKLPPDEEEEEEEETGKDKDEVTWPRVALALDNLFFVLFLIINALTTAVVFAVCASN